jgi:nitrogen regulatory protein PII
MMIFVIRLHKIQELLHNLADDGYPAVTTKEVKSAVIRYQNCT